MPNSNQETKWSCLSWKSFFVKHVCTFHLAFCIFVLLIDSFAIFHHQRQFSCNLPSLSFDAVTNASIVQMDHSPIFKFLQSLVNFPDY